jgi:type I restriction enzyme S subunit
MNKLIEIAEVTSGQGAPQSREYFSKVGIPFVRAGNLEMLITSGEENNCELITKENADKLGLRLFPKDTILFAKSGMSATLGRVYRLKSPCYVTNHLAAIIPNNSTDPSYLQRWFEYYPPSRLIPNESYPSIRLSDIQNLELNIPKDSSEQKRISNLLDKADSIRKKRQEAIRLADEFLRSTFLDMFGDPKKNPKGFRTEPIGNYIAEFRNENPLSYPNKLYSYIDISSIDNTNKKVIKTNKYLGSEAPSRARQLVCKGDIIISTVRPNLNAVAIIEDDYENLITSTGFCVLKCNNEILHMYYLFTLLTSQYFILEMTKIAKGASYPAISNNDILNFRIPIPSAHLQKKYSDMFIAVSHIKQKFESYLTESENLFNSLMQCAFRGEL